MEVIEAVYDHGVLKPLKKVDLKEGEKVRIVLKRSLYEVISELEKEFEDVDEDLGEVLMR